ncbi:hypothetical protein CP532_1256 [Ophiocordyceps camponoti-leonardi (nom. inval.)]|nr:hypothetical protein CP532_1256 [Ophiocordyceps camponoti-leonardi (nom. inval.)]
MDAVDVSDRYEVAATEEKPSLLVVVLDTNPHAWVDLDDRLPLNKAVANLLVFVNAHLACSSANQAAIVAAHVKRAVWLYPPPPPPPRITDSSGDVPMNDAHAPPPPPPPSTASKYHQFGNIETTVFSSLQKLINETTVQDLDAWTTRLAGALKLALCYLNKTAEALGANASSLAYHAKAHANSAQPIKSRILVISVSDSDPSEYISTMNAANAAARVQVTIDTLSLAGEATFLQQACFTTDGHFLAASKPQGLLSYLMYGFIADTEARKLLFTPNHYKIDSRAACTCHNRVLDKGLLCTICLTTFCEPPPGLECLTCGTKLELGKDGEKPAVVPKKKKKKTKKTAATGTGSGREETGSATVTVSP